MLVEKLAVCHAWRLADNSTSCRGQVSSSTLLGEQTVAKREQERKLPWEKVSVALTTLNDCGDKRGDGQGNCLRDV